MQVAITSDIHNNLANLKKVLDYCNSKKIGTMICCGDLASLETLDFLNDNFAGEIFYCFGNMDDGQMKTEVFKNPSPLLPLKKGERITSPFACLPARQGKRGRGNLKNVQVIESCKYKNTLIFKNHGEIKIAGKSIAFVHYPDIAKKLAESGKYDFVFYGHTHKPWSSFVSTDAKAMADKKTSEDKEENINGCLMLNPGNVANELYPPTFAVWKTENDKFELVKVNDLK